MLLLYSTGGIALRDRDVRWMDYAIFVEVFLTVLSEEPVLADSAIS